MRSPSPGLEARPSQPSIPQQQSRKFGRLCGVGTPRAAPVASIFAATQPPEESSMKRIHWHFPPRVAASRVRVLLRESNQVREQVEYMASNRRGSAAVPVHEALAQCAANNQRSAKKRVSSTRVRGRPARGVRCRRADAPSQGTTPPRRRAAYCFGGSQPPPSALISATLASSRAWRTRTRASSASCTLRCASSTSRKPEYPAS